MTVTGPSPRTGTFLRHTIPTSPTSSPTGHYVPLAAETRADHHVPGNTYPDAWPIRQTKCGDHPGTYGDNRQPVTVLRVAR
jgi:hypothetical protein